MTDRKLDALIARAMRHDAAESEDTASAVRLLAALAAKPLPKQRKLMRWWPAPLLDIDLAPAWPRVAAFACVAALGLAVGLAGPDLGVFEPELLTGARP